MHLALKHDLLSQVRLPNNTPPVLHLVFTWIEYFIDASPTSPFPMPSDHELEEATSAWTPINTDKVYRCTGRRQGTGGWYHTKFFEWDRSQSEMGQRCQANGQYNFVNLTSNWPVCLEGLYFHSSKTWGIQFKPLQIIHIYDMEKREKTGYPS